jgi:adenosylhomocysteine nucleosidase
VNGVERDGARGAHVLLLAPMRSELQPVVKALGLERSDTVAPPPAVSTGPDRGDGSGSGARGAGRGPITLHTGRTGTTTITAARTGVGTALAAAVTERLLTALPHVDHVVVAGIAGGIGADLDIGDIVVPELVVDGVTGDEHRPDPLGDQVPAGILSTSDDLIIDPAAVAALVERGVVALDMETASVAAVCERHGCRWSAFRAISDRASDGLVDPEIAALAGSDGSADFPRVLRMLARHPSRVRDLARLGRDMRIATRAAATAAATACAAAVPG